MKVYMKINLTLCCCLLAALSSFAQSVPSSVTFKTPEVSAFNHFIEAPVSMYTGVPNISIPLYEINIKGVNVPIKLDYHAGGIRVDQDATWVGLGWSLSYGGEISRKTRGIPDEFYYFYGGTNVGYSVNHFMQLPNIGSNGYDMGAQNNRIEYINNAKRGGSDLMPDEFYYSALGYSGRFMFNQDQNKFLMYPKEDIEVSKFDGPINELGSTWKLHSWKLKLPDGISVDFGKEGYSRQNMTVMNVQMGVTNSWQIKAIKNNYNDSITYSYDNFNYRMPKISGQQYSLSTSGSSGGSTAVSDPLISDSRIRVINFPGGRIEFSTLGRQDMPNERLDDINVFDNNNNNIKKIHFNYSYFYGDAFDILGMVGSYYASRTPADYRYKRLKLESVSISVPGETPINYSFSYYTAAQMPSKYSFSQDHWGFFNGIPNTSLYGFIPNLDTHFAGGDRRVKPEYSNAFSLKSITYPEGGKTEFVYEGNTATVGNTPQELLATYQDDNFLEKYAAIAVSGPDRSLFYPSPTETINGVRYFRKQFTVSGLGFTTMNNWSISTNYGISTLEQYTPYLADNVEFKLEKINSDNSRTTIRTFNTTDPNYPYNNAPPRKGQDEGLINITSGTYEMTVAVTYLNQPNSPPDNQPYNISFFVKWRELNPLTNSVNVGGLRIKDINFYNSDETLVKKKAYSYVNSNFPNITSGKIVSFPLYHQYKQKLDVNTTTGVTQILKSLNYSSNSILPLETTSGSFAGYEFVNEYDVDFLNPGNNLRSESHFSFVQPYFSQFYTQMNLGIYEPKEWTRGKLLSKQYFSGSNVIKKEEYEYYFVSPYANNTENAEDFVSEVNTDFISFQSFAFQYPYATEVIPEDFYDVTTVGNCAFFYYSPFNNTVYNPCYYTTSVPYFRRFTGFDKIKSKVITSYDNPSAPIVQIENYAYQSAPVHYQLTKTTNTSSTGAELTTETKYPQDLSLSGTEEIARQALISNHQLNVGLMQTALKNASSQISTTSYEIDPITNLVLPKLVKTNTGFNGAFEPRNQYNKFDDKANLLELQQASGTKVCYVYSYNKLYPIAEIKNANYATIESILGGSAAVSSFAASNPTDAAVNTLINTLRSSALLKDAQITSYTYKPLVGMTSSTDAKGMTTYYEYDAFQRLKAVKDQNGNILKQTDYHYKN